MPSCIQCSASYEITDEDIAFLKKLSPVIGGTVFPLPPPSRCFRCRLQRRTAFYNARSLYRRTCSKTGASIVSMFSPDKPFTVYDKDLWLGDSWDPLSYGREVDLTRPFLEQVRELLEVVPLYSIAHFGWQNINSDFTNDNYKVKNCYLCFDGEQAEDCYFLHSYVYCKNCVDNVHITRCELCYECVHCHDCYALRFSRYCQNCSESWFLRDCSGCKNCFGCANLRQKQYCIWNEQKSKEEYEAFIGKFQSSSRSAIAKMRSTAEAHFLEFPVKAVHGEQNVNVVGDSVNRSKNAFWCFDCNDQEDCRYTTNCMMPAKDLLDVHVWGDGLELSYDSCVVGSESRNLLFCYNVSQGSSNILYSLYCQSGCAQLFGCVGLRRKKFCILNKEYTQEEYEQIVPKIIERMMQDGEWGEFFPPKISCFGYNETMAQTFFPLSETEAKAQGWQWCDYKTSVDAKRVIDAGELPDDTNDVPDDVLHWAITCEVTGKPFKLTKQELEFYRSQHLPLPRRHPDQRHADRYGFKNPYAMHDRECERCHRSIQTSYSAEKPEIVYCEECYLETVY